LLYTENISSRFTYVKEQQGAVAVADARTLPTLPVSATAVAADQSADGQPTKQELETERLTPATIAAPDNTAAAAVQIQHLEQQQERERLTTAATDKIAAAAATSQSADVLHTSTKQQLQRERRMTAATAVPYHIAAAAGMTVPNKGRQGFVFCIRSIKSVFRIWGTVIFYTLDPTSG
jgi:hypothetical protein